MINLKIPKPQRAQRFRKETATLGSFFEPLRTPSCRSEIGIGFMGKKLFRAVGEQQFKLAHLAIVAIQGGKRIGGFFQHLFRHRDGIAELLEIQ